MRHIAHRLVKQLRNVDFDDLFQVGFIGLVKSIEKYKPQMNTHFSSYAIPFIRGSMLHYLRDKHDTIRLGRGVSNFIVPARKVIEKLTVKLGRNPTHLEIAEGLKIDLDRWLEIQQNFYECNNTSLNLLVQQGGEQASEFQDLIVDRSQIDRFELNETLIDTLNAIEQLGWNEQRAIECVYLQNMTRKETARKIGVSPITITRYLVTGLRKLRVLMLQY